MLRVFPLFLALACSGGSSDDNDDNDNDDGSDPTTDTTPSDTDTGTTSSTSPTGDTATTTDPTVEDRFTNGTPTVDILFVIDDSCSMSEEQVALADNFPSFIDYFLGSGIDYHIGVTTTSVDTSGTCGVPSALGGRLARAQGLSWIDDTTPDPIPVFSELVLRGTGGSPCEKGLLATKLALGDLATAANAGFLREEAALHTIIVSDEDDQTEAAELTVSEFEDWYDGLKPEPELRQFHSVVCPEEDFITCTYTGASYIGATGSLGGVQWDIRDIGSSFMDAIGLQAAGLTSVFALSVVPDESTIEVFLDDGTAEVPFGGWTYDAAANAVDLSPYIPDPGSEVVIRYLPL